MENPSAAEGVAESLRKAREEVLAENTAQAVFKHLDALRDRRQDFAGRWIWELFQNARDAAKADGVTVHIQATRDQLTFGHDGRAFAQKEIAHLIYHGSTKVDTGDVGHFGSGFLSTHLLSASICIRGELEDGRPFEFKLDRSGRTVEELHRGMETSWHAFVSSTHGPSSEVGRATEFVYAVTEDTRSLAEEGLRQLRALAPLLLAFSPEIRAIRVSSSDGSWSVVRGNSESLGPDVSLLTIEDRIGDQSSNRRVAIAGDPTDVQVAIPLRVGPSGLEIDLDRKTPRLFLVFPLLTTERLQLPAIINSRRFKPLESRDGIVLKENSPGAILNRGLLERSAQHTVALLTHAARRKWHGFESVLALSTSATPDWVDQEWLSEHYRSLVKAIREIPLVHTVGGESVTPRQSWIPFSENDQLASQLWDLLAAIQEALVRLPAPGETASWSANLLSWAALYRDGTADFPESFPIERLAGLVAETRTVEGAKLALSDGTDPLSWLTDLIGTVVMHDRTKLFDQFSVLPNQTGQFRRRNDLFSDGGIAEELKDISAGLGIVVRDSLLERAVSTPLVGDLFKIKSQDDAVEEIISELQQRCREGSLPISQARDVAALLSWLASHEGYEDTIDGLPVITADQNDAEVTVVTLHSGAEAAPLAPPRFWPEDARAFASLFPKRRVLNELTAELLTTVSVWNSLAARGFIRLSPLYSTSRQLTFPANTAGLTDEEPEHRTVANVTVTEIAFLTEEDVGLLNKARKSISTAKELVRFIVNFVIGADGNAFNQQLIECECEQRHLIYSAGWLIPLVERKWIPSGADGRGTAHVSAASLSSLLSDDLDIIRKLSVDPGTQLLRALGVSPADFQLRAVAKDEDTRLALVTSMGDLARAAGDLGRLQSLVSEISQHPALIEDIEAKRVRRERILNNQRLGALVEKLLREEFEDCGLVVRRTGVGSDYEVESDFTDDGGEVLLEVAGPNSSTLIEVKSVRVDYAKMTPVQARKACDERRRFALCVVPLEDDSPTREDVRANSRFVFGIGDIIAEHYDDYAFYLEATGEATRKHGPVEVEIIEGQVRFKIDRAVWAEEFSLDAAVAEIVRRTSGP